MTMDKAASPAPRQRQAKKVTGKDVALRAGVSKWTVSRAFTEGASIAPDLRDSILKISAELGYSPNLLARSLSTRSTRLIGLVVDELGNPNQLRTLNEATRQLQSRGYSTLLLNLVPDYNTGTALKLANQFQVDGIIFLGTTLTHGLIQYAQQIKHIPLVIILRNSGQADIPYVTTDGYAAGAEIADLLLDQGHTRIGYMAGPMAERTELRRLEGFRDQIEKRGMALTTILEAAHYRRDEGMQTLLRHIEATPRQARLEALFCENDILAIGALDALVAANVQRKIAIVGFDDIELAASPSYQLTTFRQPIEFLVSEAIRRILETPDDSHSSLMAPGSLVLRTSHLRFP